MSYQASSPEEYITQLPKDQQNVMEKLRKVIKKLSLPFTNLASQKISVNLYQSIVYANQKLDKVKGCILFKNMDDIPYILIGILVSKITVNQ